jgi:hypothetical protein
MAERLWLFEKQREYRKSNKKGLCVEDVSLYCLFKLDIGGSDNVIP